MIQCFHFLKQGTKLKIWVFRSIPNSFWLSEFYPVAQGWLWGNESQPKMPIHFHLLQTKTTVNLVMPKHDSLNVLLSCVLALAAAESFQQGQRWVSPSQTSEGELVSLCMYSQILIKSSLPYFAKVRTLSGWGLYQDWPFYDLVCVKWGFVMQNQSIK